LRDAVKDLNKATLSDATGISYSRLRKYASGLIPELTTEERLKIYEYLLKMADKFKN
jgi:hypothetical protein